MVVIRLVFGVVGTAVVTIGTFENGACDYKDTEYWGPVYTIYDTFIDLYVTVVISVVLISHIRSLDLGSIRVNISLYTSVVYNNIIRTVLLTIVNTISAVFIITRNKNEYIMLVWPIINIIFIVLLGYDSDVTKAIRQLQQRRWNKDISSSHISLDHSASASRAPDKRQLRPTELRRMSDSNLYTEKALSDEGYKAPNLFNKSVGNTSCDTDNTQIEV
ncbi:hypothetical protein BY458DRAFT_430018 [Sporodiniella umbellata]|nr:hypothetical protein BY458DRAFT_430018 [Sporodiniella umbellata]